MADIKATSVAAMPTGWMYRRIHIGTYVMPYYASPSSQIILLSITCFLSAGMFNTISGLGGGGRLNADVANKATVALFSVFAIVAFFAGSICNIFGVQKTLFFGALGYPLYVGSFLSYNHNKNEAFVIAAGIVLGVSAGLLWTAQGTIMMAYAGDHQKGRYIAIFWAIFNAGAVISALVPVIQNVSTTEASVGDGTYIGFLALTLLGCLMALSVCRADNVVRPDGSKITFSRQPSWSAEIVGAIKFLKSQPSLLLLFPMFFSSNWFYLYQFNDVNLARFNIRTRSLNNLMYWLAQIISAFIFGSFLDTTRLKRRTRSICGLVALFIITMITWGCGYVFQKGYTRESIRDHETSLIDWNDKSFAAPFVLYWFYGFFGGAWQTYVYWLLGALTNSGNRLAYLAGLYKSLQSAGAAVTYHLDELEQPYMDLLLSSWVLLVGSLLVALPVVLFMVHENDQGEAENTSTQPTLAEEVRPPHFGAEKAKDAIKIIP